MPSEHDIAFPRLSRVQIDALRPWGRVRPIAPGDVLFPGRRPRVFLLRRPGRSGRDRRAIRRYRRARVTVHEPGEFTGDVDTLSGRASLVSGRATARGEVLELTAAALRQAVDALPEIGETVLKAFLTRRTLLLSDGFEGIKTHRITVLAGRAPPQGFCESQRDPVHLARSGVRRAGRDAAAAVRGAALGDAGGDRP